MRVSRVALAGVVRTLVAGSLGVGVAMAPSASAAVVTTSQINCGTSATSVTSPAVLTTSDTFVVS